MTLLQPLWNNEPDILDTDSLKAMLKQQAGLSEPFSLTAVEGGQVNQNYRLHAAGQVYMVKVFGSEHQTALERSTMLRIQQEVAGHGLAPRPVYLADDCSVLVEQWIDAPSLASSNLDKQSEAEVLGRTLAAIHAIPLTTRALDLPAEWQQYLSMTDSAVAEEYADELARARHHWEAYSQLAPVLCHNDLNADHLTTNDPVIVFDWEYAALGPPGFDLAACAEVNQLEDEWVCCLLQVYATQRNLPVATVIEAYEQFLPLVRLTNTLWYLAANSSKAGDKKSN